MKENTTKTNKTILFLNKTNVYNNYFQKYLHNINIYINFATKTIHI